VKAYEAIVKGENIAEPSIPESFKVLLKEMQSLALDVNVVSEEGERTELRDEDDDLLRAAEELGIDLAGVRGPAGSGADEEVEEEGTLDGEDGAEAASEDVGQTEASNGAGDPLDEELAVDGVQDLDLGDIELPEGELSEEQ
jgi:DNA-directed RNA polymerase subunit beta